MWCAIEEAIHLFKFFIALAGKCGQLLRRSSGIELCDQAVEMAGGFAPIPACGDDRAQFLPGFAQGFQPLLQQSYVVQLRPQFDLAHQKMHAVEF